MSAGVIIQRVNLSGNQISPKFGRTILDIDSFNMSGVTFTGLEIFVKGAHWPNDKDLHIPIYNEGDSEFSESENHKEGEANPESSSLENKQVILGHHNIIGDAPQNEDNSSQMNPIEGNASERNLPNHPAISENQDDVSSRLCFSADDAKSNSRKYAPHYPILVPIQTRLWVSESNASQSLAILPAPIISRDSEKVIHYLYPKKHFIFS